MARLVLHFIFQGFLDQLAASSRCVSAHFTWESVKKHSWVYMLTSKPHEDQPDTVGESPLNPVHNLLKQQKRISQHQSARRGMPRNLQQPMG